MDHPLDHRLRNALTGGIALCGVGLVSLGAACSSSSAGASADGGPSIPDAAAFPPAQGCHPERAATSYAGGATASTAKTAPTSGAPTACLTLTGQGAAESSLGIAKDGSIFYAPSFGASGIGVVRSRDEGATWEPLVATLPGGIARGRVQPFMYLDPSTDKVFFLTSAVSGVGFDLSESADEGNTWESSSVIPESVDWAKIYAGPAVTSKPQGYPNILYMSAPSPISTPSPATATPDHQVVYSSLDGGKTWTLTGGTLSLKPADVPGCDPNEWVIYGNGVVAPDGTIYLSYRRCAHLGISISHDEGRTWTTADVPGADLRTIDTSNFGIVKIIGDENILMSEPFTVDTAGNLYAVWPDAANVLRLSFTKDHAQTWSTPVVISAPGLKSMRFGAVAVKEPGTIAIAYYGSPDGKKFDGYVAESTGAFDASPVFTSVTVDDPKDPFFTQGFDSNYINSINNGDLIEFVQVRYAPSGDIWASFVKEMCPGAKPMGCTWDYAAHASSMFQGAVGRLVH